MAMKPGPQARADINYLAFNALNQKVEIVLVTVTAGKGFEFCEKDPY